MNVYHHPLANREFAKAILWYKQRNLGAASDFIEEVDATIAQIASKIRVFPLAEQNCRKALLHRFPYSIYFQEQNDSVTILAIAHAKREPTYWHGRAASMHRLE